MLEDQFSHVAVGLYHAKGESTHEGFGSCRQRLFILPYFLIPNIVYCPDWLGQHQTPHPGITENRHTFSENPWADGSLINSKVENELTIKVGSR